MVRLAAEAPFFSHLISPGFDHEGIVLPFARQTTGHHFHAAETQIHQNPRYVGVSEGVSHWQGQVQFVKVRQQFIQHNSKFC